MEITLNLPPKDWYRNSSVNDLSYWGLDYPPLTAYQSYIHGVFLKTFDPDSVALFTSRAYESYLGWYNCISLGLTMAAIAAALSQKDLVASVLYCLALNHKQMSAYFAPAFFSYLLGKCLKNKNPLVEVTKMGLMVIGTFAVVWWPYLQSEEAALTGGDATEARFSIIAKRRPGEARNSFLSSLSTHL
ncbi:Rad23 UV excision repair protein family isoform 1 [Hibiscus syriacus]|uniref:Alpha-1,3-glucosyltransferase n=1 Tax=Hibiscus syriacus TaxID=106335 RepID=A0A6A2WJ17_HIBSY|nr:Rad23 UV excision repair protein family isoform 1 [Hibiscus syriacus]